MRKKMNAEVKAKILMEALPYIKRYRSKKVVIKYGGKAMLNSKLQKSVMMDIALLKLVGMKVVLVHGGGPQINELLEKLSIKSDFFEGMRITNEKSMEIVRMVMVGKVNKELVSILNSHDLKAIGLSGEDGNLLMVKKLKAKKDLGYVGEVMSVNTDMLEALLHDDYLPVIASIGIGRDMHAYNLNADHVAASIAIALKAEKLIFLTDVDGVLLKENGEKKLASVINARSIRGLIKKGKVRGGMIPKLLGCADAIEKGVRRAHILNGTMDHALLLEVFTDEGIGTMVVGGDVSGADV